MKLVKITIAATSIAVLGFYCALDQRYVTLTDNERLFNSKLYSFLGTEVTLGKEMKGFSEAITVPFPERVKIKTEVSEALKRVKTIADYTVKLQTHCSSGTGWFLDYEIPTGNKNYPTKWFIATNAHVISNYKFEDNPYEQTLPVSGLLNGCARYGESTTVYLLRDQKADVTNFQTSTYTVFPKNENVKLETLIDSVAWNAKDNQSSDKAFVYSKLESPKLLYVPTNFLGKRYQAALGLSWKRVNYIKDFAVLEVNFPTETEAKNLTNDFYNKRNSNQIEEINFFADELIKNKTGDELIQNEEDYFFAGYPGSEYDRAYKFSLTTNFSYNNQKVGKLVGIHPNDPSAVKNNKEQALPGHHLGNLKVNWNGKDHSYWGYQYAITNINEVAPGASGSIIIDSNRDALGILTSMTTYTSNPVVFVTPLKSDGLILDSKLIYPPYDLIKGNQWQLGSYKEQLFKYFPDLNTYLKSKLT